VSLNPPDASEFADELARAVVDGSAAKWAPAWRLDECPAESG